MNSRARVSPASGFRPVDEAFERKQGRRDDRCGTYVTIGCVAQIRARIDPTSARILTGSEIMMHDAVFQKSILFAQNLLGQAIALAIRIVTHSVEGAFNSQA